MTHSIYNLRFNVPNKIAVIFHNDSNFDYNFIIKALAKKFKKQFECLGWNTENYNPFSTPIKREITKVDKEGNENIIIISSKINFIDSERFVASSLSNLFFAKLNLMTVNVNENLITNKWLSCNKNYSNKIDQEIKNWFKNALKQL